MARIPTRGSAQALRNDRAAGVVALPPHIPVAAALGCDPAGVSFERMGERNRMAAGKATEGRFICFAVESLGRTLRAVMSLHLDVRAQNAGRQLGDCVVERCGDYVEPWLYQACVRASGTPAKCSDDANAHFR